MEFFPPLPYQPGGKLPDMQKAKERQIERGWRQMETQELMSTLKVDIPPPLNKVQPPLNSNIEDFDLHGSERWNRFNIWLPQLLATLKLNRVHDLVTADSAKMAEIIHVMTAKERQDMKTSNMMAGQVIMSMTDQHSHQLLIAKCGADNGRGMYKFLIEWVHRDDEHNVTEALRALLAVEQKGNLNSDMSLYVSEWEHSKQLFHDVIKRLENKGRDMYEILYIAIFLRGMTREQRKAHYERLDPDKLLSLEDVKTMFQRRIPMAPTSGRPKSHYAGGRMPFQPSDKGRKGERKIPII